MRKTYPDNLCHMEDRILFNLFSIMACNIKKSSTHYVGIFFNLLRVIYEKIIYADSERFYRYNYII